MVDNKDEILQSGCVNRSLHVPLRTKEDLRRYFETYVSQLSFKDMNLKPPSIQVRSTPTTTPKLEFPNGIKRTNKGTRQREDARTPPKKMARIMKAPCSVSRKVSIDTDMFHNLCLLAYGESLVYQTEENVENDAPSSWFVDNKSLCNDTKLNFLFWFDTITVAKVSCIVVEESRSFSHINSIESVI